jgi:hypothetical protein
LRARLDQLAGRIASSGFARPPAAIFHCAPRRSAPDGEIGAAAPSGKERRAADPAAPI